MGISNIHDALEEGLDRDEDDAELQELRHFRDVIAKQTLDEKSELVLAMCIAAARKLKLKWKYSDA